uniref:Tryptophan--tRNA ligase n=1 Tax=Acrobeloides nanus TaxID=290746 RepID=A0A914C258_9BILA
MFLNILNYFGFWEAYNRLQDLTDCLNTKTNLHSIKIVKFQSVCYVILFFKPVTYFYTKELMYRLVRIKTNICMSLEV